MLRLVIAFLYKISIQLKFLFIKTLTSLDDHPNYFWPATISNMFTGFMLVFHEWPWVSVLSFSLLSCLLVLLCAMLPLFHTYKSILILPPMLSSTISFSVSWILVFKSYNNLGILIVSFAILLLFLILTVLMFSVFIFSEGQVSL